MTAPPLWQVAASAFYPSFRRGEAEDKESMQDLSSYLLKNFTKSPLSQMIVIVIIIITIVLSDKMNQDITRNGNLTKPRSDILNSNFSTTIIIFLL